MEVGTLKELNVKPGDVLGCVDNKYAGDNLQIGRDYRCFTAGTVRDELGVDFHWTFAKFCVVSRASDSYRDKPEPVRETVGLYAGLDRERHPLPIGTIDLIDGNPVPGVYTDEKGNRVVIEVLF